MRYSFDENVINKMLQYLQYVTLPYGQVKQFEKELLADATPIEEPAEPEVVVEE